MPTYMDTHQGAQLPDELRRTVETRVRSGEPDANGVIDRGIIMDKDGGTLHCILDAPDEAAVMRHHADLHVPVQEESIHRADAILR